MQRLLLSTTMTTEKGAEAPGEAEAASAFCVMLQAAAKQFTAAGVKPFVNKTSQEKELVDKMFEKLEDKFSRLRASCASHCACYLLAFEVAPVCALAVLAVVNGNNELCTRQLLHCVGCSVSWLTASSES